MAKEGGLRELLSTQIPKGLPPEVYHFSSLPDTHGYEAMDAVAGHMEQLAPKMHGKRLGRLSAQEWASTYRKALPKAGLTKMAMEPPMPKQMTKEAMAKMAASDSRGREMGHACLDELEKIAGSDLVAEVAAALGKEAGVNAQVTLGPRASWSGAARGFVEDSGRTKLDQQLTGGAERAFEDQHPDQLRRKFSRFSEETRKTQVDLSGLFDHFRRLDTSKGNPSVVTG